MDYPGNLFVVAAPSGAGKSSLVKALLELDSHLVVSISHTTRASRAGRSSRAANTTSSRMRTFREKIAHGDFFEWAEVHGQPVRHLARGGRGTRALGGQDVVLEIDWQGALQIKRLFPNAVLIFILPPSFEELLQRLAPPGRGPSGRDRASGWTTPASRWTQARHFDFVIINASVRNGAVRPEGDRSFAAFEVRRPSQRSRPGGLRGPEPELIASRSRSPPGVPAWPASPSKTA